MALISDKQIFVINSNNRITGTSNDFTINLDFDPNKDFDSVTVLQCLIPLSYYLIQDGQNTFTLQEGANQVTITIPIGNYTRKSFATVLASILNSSSPNSFTYTITYPNSATQGDTGLYTYTVSNNAGVQPIFIFSQYCNEPMGFNENSTNVFSSNTLISTNVIKLSPEDSILIHSDLCSNYGNDILQEVYTATTGTFSSIVFQNFDIESNYKKLTTTKNNVYRLYITSEEFLPINLNGQNIVITLMLFKKNDIWSMLKGIIKYMLLSK